MNHRKNNSEKNNRYNDTRDDNWNNNWDDNWNNNNWNNNNWNNNNWNNNNWNNNRRDLDRFRYCDNRNNMGSINNNQINDYNYNRNNNQQYYTDLNLRYIPPHKRNNNFDRNNYNYSQYYNQYLNNSNNPNINNPNINNPNINNHNIDHSKNTVWKKNPTWFRNDIPKFPPNNYKPVNSNISSQTDEVDKPFIWGDKKYTNDILKQQENNLSNIIKSIDSSINEIFKNTDAINIKSDNSTPANTKTSSNEEIENDVENMEFEILEENIETISDLINLGMLYETKYKNVKKIFSLDLKILNNMIEPLIELNNLVGLLKVKKQLFDQIIFYLQSLDNKNFDMLHTVIAGSPGTGKTELAKIISKIYNKMGILSKGTFNSVKRSDLIGGYLGQTAIKTQKVLDEAKGGVLFIDEAYSLGNKEGKDSFSKECIDTLTAFLTEEKEDFICIIAGYNDDLDKCFFAHNSGLKRRFNWKFTIDKYSPNDLRSIFIKKIYDYQWKIKSEEDISLEIFENNIDLFEFNGGDMETLFQKCKMVHSLRVLKSHPSEKKIINKIDLIKGLETFKDIKDIKKDNNFHQLMYT